jgi:hypothetical protein
MPALHQRNEVPTLDGAALDPEMRERVRRGESAAGGLCRLAARRQVVVAALGRNGLALQIARVAATLRGADAGRDHHHC